MQDILDWIGVVGLSRIVWATDLDETLVDSHGSRGDGTGANDDLVQLCRDMERALNGRFYIVTGRDMESLDRILPGLNPKASTEYHSMLRHKDGTVDLGPRPHWHLIDDALDAIAARFDGVLVRKKPFMRTVKFGASPALAADKGLLATVRDEVEALMQHVSSAQGVHLVNIDGGRVFDLAPGGRDKADGIRWVVEHAAADYKGDGDLVPVYCGDSPGDLPGAKVVQGMGGKFISVGPDPRVTAVADFTLPDTASCRALMRALMKV